MRFLRFLRNHFVDILDPKRFVTVRVLFTLLLLLAWCIEIFS